MRGGGAKLSVSVKSLRKYLDEADDLSSKVVIKYFKEHSLDQLRWRLYYDYEQVPVLDASCAMYG